MTAHSEDARHVALQIAHDHYCWAVAFGLKPYEIMKSIGQVIPDPTLPFCIKTLANKWLAL